MMASLEIRFLILGRAILSLLFVTRKLRAYFQGHPIVVVTSLPLRNGIHSPKKSSRLIKWALKLSEHDIIFEGRKAIKRILKNS